MAETNSALYEPPPISPRVLRNYNPIHPFCPIYIDRFQLACYTSLKHRATQIDEMIYLVASLQIIGRDPREDAMWTSTLDLDPRHVIPTKLLGLFWRGAYFSSFAPLQVQNLPRQPLPAANFVRVRNS